MSAQYRSYPALVTAIDRLSPHFVRVAFLSPEFGSIGVGGPDQRIKIIFPLHGSRPAALPAGDDWYTAWREQPNEQRNPMRTYTIRATDPATGALIVDFVAHGDTGPASRWITSAALGDQLIIVAPDATTGSVTGGFEFRPGAATTFLLAGDETAVPAISAILESLPADSRGAAFLEVPTIADALQISRPPGIDLTWLPRAARPGLGYGTVLDQAVRAWTSAWIAEQGRTTSIGDNDDARLNVAAELIWEVPARPDTPGLYAWLAGEADVITGLRRHLVRDLGVDRSRVAFMGYWKNGKAEN